MTEKNIGVTLTLGGSGADAGFIHIIVCVYILWTYSKVSEWLTNL